jgi:hypothetical protein
MRDEERLTGGRSRRLGGALAAALLAIGAALACHAAAVARDRSAVGEDLPAATPDLGGFAFPDGAGSRLLLLGASAHGFNDRTFIAMEKAAPTLRTAFCSGGRAIPVAFDHRQPADGKGNGRQSHFQFEHLDGLVFSLTAAERLPETGTCLLAPAIFTRDLQVVPLALAPEVMPARPRPACDGGLSKRLASRRSRAVDHCWSLAAPQVAGGPSVVLAEFARQGNSALASLVVVSGETMVFADQQGDYSREGAVWRVDDDGKLEPEWFDVVLLARRGQKLVMAFAWQGAEGRVLRLLESDGDRFRELLGESWYEAPV